MSHVQAYYHIVINTKERRRVIPAEHKRELYAYIYGILKNKCCKVLRINGMENHVHLLIELNPTLSLSFVVGLLKQSSSLWMHTQPNFSRFEFWGKEYYAASVSRSDVGAVKDYIIGQEVHHTKVSFEDEFRQMIGESGMDWNDNMLT